MPSLSTLLNAVRHGNDVLKEVKTEEGDDWCPSLFSELLLRVSSSFVVTSVLFP